MRRVFVGLLLAVLAGCGGSQAEPPATQSGIEAALLSRLEARDLSVRWVRCVGSRFVYERQPIFRCNVNFGDPHIEAYCAVLVAGELLTHFEDSGLRCARERTEEGEPVG